MENIDKWRDWDNVACRKPLKLELEKRAKKERRNPTNYLEIILEDALGIRVPEGVGKKK